MKSILHEIRNHLAVAVANVEAFRDGVLEPSPARLSAVLQALGEAEVLLGELPVDVAAVRAEPDVHAINVCAIITNEVLALEASARERRIDFHVDQCDEPHHSCAAFNANPLHVAEIVNNVISNAIRYTAPGGRIDVDCHRADGALELSVTDDGPGVDWAERARIFEPGFRGAAASAGDSGTGMGLAVTKRLVETHGGSIRVTNVAGRGARFIIILPDEWHAPAARPTEDSTVSLL